MAARGVLLAGEHVRLEPLTLDHAEGLAAAADGGEELYRWSPVPRGLDGARTYIATALSWRNAGTAEPYATIRMADGAVIGSTRFFLLEHWTWPDGHPRSGRAEPDGCEIGYTWLSPRAVRTAANTEAKLLMLRHAFETWGALRVCFHADMRNVRSRVALEGIGARFEGVLRAHRVAVDGVARDSARFSILADEWPAVVAGLKARLERLTAS